MITLSDPYINLPGTRLRPFTPDPTERTEVILKLLKVIELFKKRL